MHRSNSRKRDVRVSDKIKPFRLDLHASFLAGFYDERVEQYKYNYRKLNAIGYNLTSLLLINQGDLVNKDLIVEFMEKCKNDDGGYGPYPKFGSNIHSTLSAIQISIMLDRFEYLDIEALTKYIVSLQGSDGCFTFDSFGEKDTRCCFFGVASLYFLNKLDAIDKKSCINYIISCLNFDGSFGAIIGAESHAAQVFCCVSSLLLMNSQSSIDSDALGLWLSERQCESGGFNGRPAKLPDSCYSWWVLSSLNMIHKEKWFKREKLILYLMECQDHEKGGFSDRPGNVVDPFHTLFSLAALSLMRAFPDRLLPVNPIVFMPENVLENKFPEINRIYKHT